jgi:hypothetical protein
VNIFHEGLVHVGSVEPMVTLHLSGRIAFRSLAFLLAVDLVNIAVMKLNGPVSRPLVSRQLFSECHTPMLATFAEAAHNKPNCILVRSLGYVDVVLVGNRRGFLFFWT